MTVAFLAVLAVAWIAVFLPAALRARQSAPSATAERWRRRMDLISPRSSTGRWVLVPQNFEEMAQAAFERGQRRRRRIFAGLVAVTVITLGVALLNGGAAWEVQLACDASLALYVMLLREAKRRRLERRSKVRRLPQPVYVHKPGVRVLEPLHVQGGR